MLKRDVHSKFLGRIEIGQLIPPLILLAPTGTQSKAKSSNFNACARLVANRKHLEMSKSDRTWAICVDGLGGADGSLPDGLVCRWWTWIPESASEITSTWCENDGYVRHDMVQEVQKSCFLILVKPISSCTASVVLISYLGETAFFALRGVYDRIGAKHGKARDRKICKQESELCKFLNRSSRFRKMPQCTQVYKDIGAIRILVFSDALICQMACFVQF